MKAALSAVILTLALGVATAAAWIGEYLVVASGLLANELALWYSPLTGVAIWLAATAGPMQPAAAWLVVVLARRRRRRIA